MKGLRRKVHTVMQFTQWLSGNGWERAWDDCNPGTTSTAQKRYAVNSGCIKVGAEINNIQRVWVFSKDNSVKI